MNYLRLLRSTKGMSQGDLAERLKTSRYMVSQLEGGWFAKVSPSMATRLQDVFGSDWTFDRLMEQVPEPTAKDATTKAA